MLAAAFAPKGAGRLNGAQVSRTHPCHKPSFTSPGHLGQSPAAAVTIILDGLVKIHARYAPWIDHSLFANSRTYDLLGTLYSA